MKIFFFFGIVLLFLYSKSFALADREIISASREFHFENTNILFHLEPESSGSQFINQNWSSGPDSVNRLAASGKYSQGCIITSDTDACSGSVFELNSKTALSYQWTPADRMSNPAIQNPYVIIDNTCTYFLLTTDYTNNLVINPGFELGNTGFYTAYTFCDGVNCLSPLGDNGYSVGTNANYFHSYFAGKDHTSGTGNFMIVNGARPTLTVWQQTIPVKSYTDYAFGVWISTMISLSPAQIQFSINGGQVGALYNAPDYANKWEQVFTTWNSGYQTTATIKIVDILPVLQGNDFGLDDLFFGEIISCSDSVTVTASRNVNLGNDTLITPPSQQIVLASSVGPFEQYTWNTGDTAQTITINDPGVYWLSAIDLAGCKSVDTLLVRSTLIGIEFPNAFSPNSDRINDVFRPKASNISKFHMSIFNRWGQFLYETDDIIAGWNGLVEGKNCPADLYVYITTYELQDIAGTKTTRGSFRLIR
ncbi:MAG: T9SS type B sorting domain-containing protein [Bacteroidota bacterium]